MRQLVKRFTVQVPVRERSATADGLGKRWVTIGYKTAIVDVEIDLMAAFKLAEKAGANKTQRAKSGPVYAKAFCPKDATVRCYPARSPAR